ncbi:MAG TPA: nucleotide exchange factor GrpE [Candidatus Woesebacteria bacterium]|nr:nucleotide exchange factor GrpE [Candidatus Woesebacteria bacterium]
MKKKQDKQTVSQEKTEETTSEEQKKIQELQRLLASSLEREKRILADYQNLQRRVQEERLVFIKMANKDLCQALLQPLEHLSLAAANIKNQGLDMVIDEFWKELHDFGLTEIEVIGKKFDLKTMEAVDKKGDGEQVVEVVRKGYMLNGEVIQHAKVVLS